LHTSGVHVLWPSEVYEPSTGGQVEQDDDPAAAAKVPAPQLEQVVEPELTENFPATQLMH